MPIDTDVNYVISGHDLAELEKISSQIDDFDLFPDQRVILDRIVTKLREIVDDADEDEDDPRGEWF